MAYQPTCLITGCELLDPANPDQYAHGDLHLFGEMLIFVAVRSDGRVAWLDSTSLTPKSKTVLPPRTFFERQGVFIFPKASAELNDVARLYIRADASDLGGRP